MQDTGKASPNFGLETGPLDRGTWLAVCDQPQFPPSRPKSTMWSQLSTQRGRVCRGVAGICVRATLCLSFLTWLLAPRCFEE